MAQTAPILDLVLTERPIIKINGRPYEMRTADEFAYLAYRQQQKLFARLGVLLKKKRATKAEEQEQVRLLDTFVRQLLVDVDDKVHKKLRDSHRLEIITAFFRQRQPATSRAAAATTGNRPLTASAPGRK